MSDARRGYNRIRETSGPSFPSLPLVAERGWVHSTPRSACSSWPLSSTPCKFSPPPPPLLYTGTYITDTRHRLFGTLCLQVYNFFHRFDREGPLLKWSVRALRRLYARWLLNVHVGVGSGRWVVVCLGFLWREHGFGTDGGFTRILNTLHLAFMVQTIYTYGSHVFALAFRSFST